ncbi:hypothetical protein FQR65_LT20805 [Abscondita terminalis]|nr:hypothetical protein FQR65_LT20805 [Abscondita terminalis]
MRPRRDECQLRTSSRELGSRSARPTKLRARRVTTAVAEVCSSQVTAPVRRAGAPAGAASATAISSDDALAARRVDSMRRRPYLRSGVRSWYRSVTPGPRSSHLCHARTVSGRPARSGAYESTWCPAAVLTSATPDDVRDRGRASRGSPSGRTLAGRSRHEPMDVVRWWLVCSTIDADVRGSRSSGRSVPSLARGRTTGLCWLPRSAPQCTCRRMARLDSPATGSGPRSGHPAAEQDQADEPVLALVDGVGLSGPRLARSTASTAQSSPAKAGLRLPGRESRLCATPRFARSVSCGAPGRRRLEMSRGRARAGGPNAGRRRRARVAHVSNLVLVQADGRTRSNLDLRSPVACRAACRTPSAPTCCATPRHSRDVSRRRVSAARNRCTWKSSSPTATPFATPPTRGSRGRRREHRRPGGRVPAPARAAAVSVGRLGVDGDGVRRDLGDAATRAAARAQRPELRGTKECGARSSDPLRDAGVGGVVPSSWSSTLRGLVEVHVLACAAHRDRRRDGRAMTACSAADARRARADPLDGRARDRGRGDASLRVVPGERVGRARRTGARSAVDVRPRAAAGGLSSARRTAGSVADLRGRSTSATTRDAGAALHDEPLGLEPSSASRSAATHARRARLHQPLRARARGEHALLDVVAQDALHCGAAERPPFVADARCGCTHGHQVPQERPPGPLAGVAASCGVEQPVRNAPGSPSVAAASASSTSGCGARDRVDPPPSGRRRPVPCATPPHIQRSSSGDDSEQRTHARVVAARGVGERASTTVWSTRAFLHLLHEVAESAVGHPHGGATSYSGSPPPPRVWGHGPPRKKKASPRRACPRPGVRNAAARSRDGSCASASAGLRVSSSTGSKSASATGRATALRVDRAVTVLGSKRVEEGDGPSRFVSARRVMLSVFMTRARTDEHPLRHERRCARSRAAGGARAGHVGATEVRMVGDDAWSTRRRSSADVPNRLSVLHAADARSGCSDEAREHRAGRALSAARRSVDDRERAVVGCASACMPSSRGARAVMGPTRREPVAAAGQRRRAEPFRWRSEPGVGLRAPASSKRANRRRAVGSKPPNWCPAYTCATGRRIARHPTPCSRRCPPGPQLSPGRPGELVASARRASSRRDRAARTPATDASSGSARASRAEGEGRLARCAPLARAYARRRQVLTPESRSSGPRREGRARHRQPRSRLRRAPLAAAHELVDAVKVLGVLTEHQHEPVAWPAMAVGLHDLGDLAQLRDDAARSSLVDVRGHEHVSG